MRGLSHSLTVRRLGFTGEAVIGKLRHLYLAKYFRLTYFTGGWLAPDVSSKQHSDRQLMPEVLRQLCSSDETMPTPWPCPSDTINWTLGARKE